MISKHRKHSSILSKTVSAVLIFWLSSILVLVCCSPHLLMASVSSVKVEEESCPMQKGHECCQKNKDAKKVSETEKSSANCCIFKPQRTLSSDLKTVKITKQTQIVSERIEPSKSVYFIKTSYKPQKTHHSAIRNRGSTYLQNCVFRI